jgi:hypothetical protein
VDLGTRERRTVCSAHYQHLFKATWLHRKFNSARPIARTRYASSATAAVLNFNDKKPTPIEFQARGIADTLQFYWFMVLLEANVCRRVLTRFDTNSTLVKYVVLPPLDFNHLLEHHIWHEPCLVSE